MAGRPIASLTIAFGLVARPVQIFTAAESTARLAFNLLHKDCGSRLKQQYVCINDGQKIQRADIVKGSAHRTPIGRAETTITGRPRNSESATRCSGVLDNENAGAHVPASSAALKVISMLLSGEGGNWSKPLAGEDAQRWTRKLLLAGAAITTLDAVCGK
jgi:hypothetical protein